MKMPTVLMPHRYRNALLNYWVRFDITNSVDLLPFVCSPLVSDYDEGGTKPILMKTLDMMRNEVLLPWR